MDNDLTILKVEFDCEGYWSKAIDESDERFEKLVSGNQCVHLFDQNGYDLCPQSNYMPNITLKERILRIIADICL